MVETEPVTPRPERIAVWIPDIDIVLLRVPPGVSIPVAVAQYIAQRLRDAGVPVRPSTLDVGLPAWTGLEYGQIVECKDDVRGGRLYVWKKNRLRLGATAGALGSSAVRLQGDSMKLRFDQAARKLARIVRQSGGTESTLALTDVILGARRGKVTVERFIIWYLPADHAAIDKRLCGEFQSRSSAIKALDGIAFASQAGRDEFEIRKVVR